MNHSLLQTWSHLSLLQKLALIGLIILALSLPLAIIGSTQQTRLKSDAFMSSPPMTEEQKLQLALKKQTAANTPSLTTTSGRAPFVGAGCRISGCSSELCLDRDGPNLASPCVYKEEYACYQKLGRCESQANGQCGWTPSVELNTCLGIIDPYESTDTPATQPSIQPIPTSTPQPSPTPLPTPTLLPTASPSRATTNRHSPTPTTNLQDESRFGYQDQFDEITEVKCTPRPSCMFDTPPCQVFYEDPNWCPLVEATHAPTPIPLPTPKTISIMQLLKEIFGF